MLDYRFDPQALSDIQLHYEYLLRRDVGAADRFLDRLFDKLSQLAKNPEMAAARPEIGEQIRSVSLAPHVIFYSLAVSDLVILRVLHGSQDVGRAFPQS